MYPKCVRKYHLNDVLKRSKKSHWIILKHPLKISQKSEEELRLFKITNK